MKTIPLTLDALDSTEYIINSFIMFIGKKFTEAGFLLPDEDVPQIKFNHAEVRCYDPASGIHDFDAVRNYGYIEALGAYFPCDEHPSQRRFELFANNIMEVAAVYTFSKTSIRYTDPAFKPIFEMHFSEITALVLCHELAHWFVHRCSDGSGMPLEKMHYQRNDEVFYHEGLAQALVFEGLKEFDSLIELMVWMEGGQPQQYIAYKRLGNDCTTLLKALSMVHKTGIQSFELLEHAVHMYEKDAHPHKEDIFKKFLSQPITAEFQKESIEDVYLHLLVAHPHLADTYRGTYHAIKFNV
jgi:hypothetical protein